MNDIMHIPSDAWITLTRYSFINTTIITSIIILLLIFITNKIKFLPKINIFFTYLVIFIIGIRLLTPFEFRFTRGISSYNVMHKVKEITNMNIISIGTNCNINVLHILCFIWVLGAVICLLKYFMGYIFLCKKANMMLPCEEERINKILSDVKDKYSFNFKTKVVIFPAFDAPSEFGLFKQTIFLNSNKYNDRELYYILLHELEHFHNKSNWFSIFLSVLSCVYWWNPIVKLFKNHMNELIETYVDDFVTQELSYAEKIDYLRCIFNICKSDKVNSNALTESILGKGKKNILLNRFKIVVDKKKINIPICILLLSIMFFYIFCSGRYVVQNAGLPPEEEINFESTDFTPENSYITKEKNIYVLHYNNGNVSFTVQNPILENLPNVPYIKN